MIVLVPQGVDFDVTAQQINAAVGAASTITGAILGNDDAVLVANRLDVKIPIIDEVSRIDLVPVGMMAAVEVAGPGNPSAPCRTPTASRPSSISTPTRPRWSHRSRGR